ncbi:MAG: hypothetical protein COB98_03990 [Flavobacteriaceae bacterium]|nr:MAG: hypothetical protein COB98_03990 [Flavobacteriaceae bacterium]
MFKFLCSIMMSTVCFSCTQVDEGEISLENEGAIAVFNQAYQENFEEDKIADILKEAHNAYVLIDPFQDSISSSILEIKANGNEVCGYISIGTGETYREDFNDMKPYLVTKSWEDWPDEYFVNTTATGLVLLMKARIDKLALWGCDWVEFDNMDWCFDQESRASYGIQATEEEGVAYFQELCDYVHLKGMKCMAKNTVIEASNFDGVLYESYNDDINWWDTSGAQYFLDAGKLVIINHYNETNCGQVYTNYKSTYNNQLSFICEDVQLKKYVHFNED